ncbi:MAG TPA: 3-dehydroquinate synthase [Verrucomicrobiae bacterium]|nr:3-dehydroquinate synthase [Verrucomicrobiae bacterium]
MKKIKVKSSKHDYTVWVGKGALGMAGKVLKSLVFQGKVFVLTQKKVARHHLPALRGSLAAAGYKPEVFEVPDGEKAKSMGTLAAVYSRLLAKGFERRDMLLALGGGVAGDLGGYAASTYLRGIRFVNAGTTLLAQVDSSIGGKTGVNLAEGKNLAGTFYPPHAVLSDIDVLKTLPEPELRASYAEVVKYGVIRDVSLFRLLERETESALLRNPAVLEEVVVRSASIKAAVVSRDEFETRGERMILNYGHTFGHGFEKNARYRMFHGDAVSLGMACAARLAVRMKMLDPFAELRQLAVLRKLGLPVLLDAKRFQSAAIMKAMMHDKKKRAGKLRFVLPENIGSVTVRQDVPLSRVRSILREMGAGR